MNTRKVTADDDGIRLAGAPDECFYCNRKVGMYHTVECVTITKQVKVQVVCEYEIDVPQTWDTHQTLFARNDASWCAGNVIGELEKRFGDEGTVGCGCNGEIVVNVWNGERYEAYDEPLEPLSFEVQGPNVSEGLPILVSLPPGTKISVSGGNHSGKWLRLDKNDYCGYSMTLEWVSLASGTLQTSGAFMDAIAIVFEIAE